MPKALQAHQPKQGRATIMIAAVDVVGVSMFNAMNLDDHQYTIRRAQGQHGSPVPARF